MNTTTLSANRAQLHRAALALVFAAVVSIALVQPALAAPPTKPAEKPADTRIAVGPETTPGDDAYSYKITQPGSYYLAGNVFGAAGKGGIAILVGGVSLDLNGMAVVGDGDNSKMGIKVLNTYGPARISNGAVLNWGLAGIEVADSTVELESLRISGNGGHGLLLAHNGRATISRCIAEENSLGGFHAYGIAVTITDSIARENGRQGFGLTNASVRGCTASLNGLHGFDVQSSVLTDCVSNLNRGNGINVTDSQVVRCTVKRGNNEFAGIRVFSHCVISGNLVVPYALAGTGPGIQVDSAFNRIEDNSVARNAVGLKATGSLNSIVRNTASFNTINYQIVVGNLVGSIIVPVPKPAINGNVGGGSGTTDPWSNFAL